MNHEWPGNVGKPSEDGQKVLKYEYDGKPGLVLNITNQGAEEKWVIEPGGKRSRKLTISWDEYRIAEKVIFEDFGGQLSLGINTADDSQGALQWVKARSIGFDDGVFEALWWSADELNEAMMGIYYIDNNKFIHSLRDKLDEGGYNRFLSVRYDDEFKERQLGAVVEGYDKSSF